VAGCRASTATSGHKHHSSAVFCSQDRPVSATRWSWSHTRQPAVTDHITVIYRSGVDQIQPAIRSLTSDERSSRLCTSHWHQKRRRTSLPWHSTRLRAWSSVSPLDIQQGTRCSTDTQQFWRQKICCRGTTPVDVGTVNVLICDRWPALGSSGDIWNHIYLGNFRNQSALWPWFRALFTYLQYAPSNTYSFDVDNQSHRPIAINRSVVYHVSDTLHTRPSSWLCCHGDNVNKMREHRTKAQWYRDCSRPPRLSASHDVCRLADNHTERAKTFAPHARKLTTPLWNASTNNEGVSCQLVAVSRHKIGCYGNVAWPKFTKFLAVGIFWSTVLTQ